MMIIHINGNLSENHAKNYVDFDILRHNPFESRTIRINLLAKKKQTRARSFLIIVKTYSSASISYSSKSTVISLELHQEEKDRSVEH